MKYLLLFLITTSLPALAALNMKPGLWQVEMSIDSHGKRINATEEIKKSMSKMDPQTRTKMRETMEMHAKLDEKGIKTCYSKAMLDRPEALSEQKGVNCDSKVINQTTTKVETKFKCEDGTKGDATWKVKNPTSYEGIVNVINSSGDKSKITYSGKYLKADCGTLKPSI